MSSTAAFDGAPERGTINFSVGQPSADLLPLKLLGSGVERFFGDAAPFDLNYGQRQGDARFRAALAAFLGASTGDPVNPDSLMLTGGISQALDFVCGRFARPGDVVFVEEPSYPYSFQIFRDHGLEVVGIPMDGDGMDIGRLEQQLRERRPKLVYTIPAFHNPTGQVMERARRDRLVALSREHDFIVVADEVYQHALPRRSAAAVVRHARLPRATCSRSARSPRSSRRACASAGSRRRPTSCRRCCRAARS